MAEDVELYKRLLARERNARRQAEALIEERSLALYQQTEERKQAEMASARSEERYRKLFDDNPLPMWVYDLQTLAFLAVNDASVSHYGFSREEFAAMTIRDIRPPEDVPSLLANVAQPNDGLEQSGVWRHLTKDGRVIEVEITSHEVDFSGRPARLVLANDITLRRRAEARVLRLNRMLAVLSGINSLIVRVHDRQELFENVCRIAVSPGGFRGAWIARLDRASSGVGLRASCGVGRELWREIRTAVRDEVAHGRGALGRVMREIKPAIADYSVDGTCSPALEQALSALGCRAAAFLPLAVDGKVLAVLALYAREAHAFDEEELRLLTELAADISFALAHLEKEEQLDYLAYYDVVTGLANRSLFADRLRQYLSGPLNDGRSKAAMLIDLQRFRHVNDTLGRHVGDALLKAVGERLAEFVQADGTLARVGADCFAIASAEPKDLATVARFVEDGVLNCFVRPFLVDDHELHVAARVGVALFPTDGADAESLYKNAEAALKKAKQSGQSCVFYAPELNATVANVLALENRLRRAIQANQFVLHYQPKVSASNGRVLGFEALVRWLTPDQGLVPPAQFIGIAEELGLIVELGGWVLNEACRQASAWLAVGHDDLSLAVNVSARQLHRSSFVDEVRDAIQAAGIKASMLELEITESAIMENVDRATTIMLGLKALGVTLVLDDFGIGYSSLSYLKRFPLDTLKIDQSFVRELTERQDDAAIVRAIIAMGHQLQMKVTAEGVETQAQLGYLRRNHCDFCQGRFFGMPQPAAEAEAVLRQRYLSVEAFAQTRPEQTLLLLDDEEYVLKALARLLRRDGFRILTAHSAAEAFDMLGREQVQVVVSDQRMPDISGTEFLNRVKQMYPETVRMILSGYTDLGTVTEAINRGSIYKFLTKPWDDEDLRAQINDAFRAQVAQREISARARD